MGISKNADANQGVIAECSYTEEDLQLLINTLLPKHKILFAHILNSLKNIYQDETIDKILLTTYKLEVTEYIGEE